MIDRGGSANYSVNQAHLKYKGSTILSKVVNNEQILVYETWSLYWNRAEERRKYPAAGNHKSMYIYAVLQLGFSIIPAVTFTTERVIFGIHLF